MWLVNMPRRDNFPNDENGVFLGREQRPNKACKNCKDCRIGACSNGVRVIREKIYGGWRRL